jgi:hypothetical protein
MKQAITRNWRAWLLGAATAVLALALWSQFWSPPAALAQSPPDAGAQRVEMIKQFDTMNTKLSEIAGLLREIRDDARKAHPESERPKRP